jgi:hypothetical protein
MSRFAQWSLGAKMLTVAAICLLLTFGLCSVGTPFEGQGTRATDFAAGAGIITFLVFVILLLAGIFTMIVQALRR